MNVGGGGGGGESLRKNKPPNSPPTIPNTVHTQKVTKNPITVPDLHATILTAMGISPRAAFNVEKRPFYVTEDGKGKAVRELFA